MDSQDSNEQSVQVNEWIRFGLRLGVNTLLHPFEYSKVLIQLGYEPIRPRQGRSMLGKPILCLPNIFQYAAYIKSVDGLFGCYRGLTPKLVGHIVGALLSEKVADELGLAAPSEDEKETSDTHPDEELTKFQATLKRDIVVHVTGIVVTQPFHVISLRMMAQFIGREGLYKSMTASIVEIYKHDGIGGFFAGIVPKLISDIACLTLASTTLYIVNKYYIKEREVRQYVAGFTQFIFASLLYPFQVVATCMAITGSGLMAGQPPVMPIYSSWVDCWTDLQTRGELKRGSSLFWRTSRTPTIHKFNYAPMPAISKYL